MHNKAMQQLSPRKVSLGKARYYNQHAEFQRSTARTLATMIRPLLQVEEASRDWILDIGTGTGFLLQLLRDISPGSNFLTLDSSSSMLRIAEEEMGPAFHAGTQIIHCLGDATQFLPGRGLGLICGNLSFHWMSDPELIVKRAAERLREGGIVAASISVEGTLGELARSKVAVVGDQRMKDVFSPEERWRAAFERAGLTVGGIEPGEEHHVYPSAIELMRSLQRSGLNARQFTGSSRALTRGELKAICAYYDEHFGVVEGVKDAGVTATYRTLFCWARKGEGR